MGKATLERIPKIKLMVPQHTNRGTGVIGGKSSGIVNWNDIRYKQMHSTYRKMISNNWIPQRIDLSKDIKQWGELDPRIKETFLKVIGQLATRDSLQTKYVSKVADYVSEPTYSPNAAVVAYQEAIHNESYSYVLASLVDTATQAKAFDDAKNDPDVQRRNENVNRLYQNFVDNPTPQTFFESLVGNVELEGLDFYSAFIFFYSLANQQMMVSTSTMIQYIQRDEMQHTYLFSQLLRYLLAENPELNTDENIQFIYDTLVTACEEEIRYIRILFKDIPDIIDIEGVAGYIRKLTNRRLRGLGLEDYYDVPDNVLPWMIAYDDESMAKTKTDSFEQKNRNYKKVDSTNEIDDI